MITPAPLCGRHTLIYRFGGEGNDWCFVRTPESYHPEGAPSPFVICNHGNGWIMDGSEQKANFSGRTQYGIDQQNNGQYLNVDDPSYHPYSNPTIEAFLDAGYVVCGAQNDGDSLYGNELCLQACIDFYHHMVRRYHIDRSNGYMLGCSNGFMTTLNASYRLGSQAVRALIGLYPLCNLRHAFEVTHKEGVSRAYKIDTEMDYAAIAGEYDPFLRTSGYEPPMLLFWSADDQVLPMQEHAVKYAEYLQNRNRIVETVRVDRDGHRCPHGDWRHFDSQMIVVWCERHRFIG